jgi:hypothetical protein
MAILNVGNEMKRRSRASGTDTKTDNLGSCDCRSAAPYLGGVSFAIGIEEARAGP